MSTQRINIFINSVDIQEMPLPDLFTLLDTSFDSNAPINTETVLLVLEVIEQRVGKKPSPSLDAAWERIKNEHLIIKQHS